jgi:hypothetical protein
VRFCSGALHYAIAGLETNNRVTPFVRYDGFRPSRKQYGVPASSRIQPKLSKLRPNRFATGDGNHACVCVIQATCERVFLASLVQREHVRIAFVRRCELTRAAARSVFLSTYV